MLKNSLIDDLVLTAIGKYPMAPRTTDTTDEMWQIMALATIRLHTPAANLEDAGQLAYNAIVGSPYHAALAREENYEGFIADPTLTWANFLNRIMTDLEAHFNLACAANQLWDLPSADPYLTSELRRAHEWARWAIAEFKQKTA